MKIKYDPEKIFKTKMEFGQRIRDLRSGADLSQTDFSELNGLGRNYISELETGTASPSIDMLITFATFFGVALHELTNPTFPIPAFNQLPAATRKAITALKKQQEQTKEKAEQRKAISKAEGVPGRAKQLHALLDAGFFKRPKTAKDAFVKLNPGIPKAALGDHLTEIGKITTTLGQGKFLRLLDKIEPSAGSIAVRFVAKTPGAIHYIDGPGGTKDMAADEG